MSDVADMTDPSVNPSVEDTTGKIDGPSFMSESSPGDLGENISGGNGVDVSQADETITEEVRSPSDVDLDKDVVEPSVKNTMHGLKGDSTSGGDVLQLTIDDPTSPNIQKFKFDQVVQHAESHAVLKPITYPSLLCSILESQKENILTFVDIEGPAFGFITISPKLMQGTHVVDIPLVTVDTGGASGSGTDEIANILRDEIRHLDGVIQSIFARKSILEACLRSLSGEDNPDADPAIGDSGSEAPQA
ncbi:hypothetical protein LIER_34088 [Lithospermum erythrorhizon]|uniref:Uncharacterized protein n=1 Tax=Lithospermum erythrorhizon TaxID=34254 RepID=A0AAV3S1R5_LITER